MIDALVRSAIVSPVVRKGVEATSSLADSSISLLGKVSTEVIRSQFTIKTAHLPDTLKTIGIDVKNRAEDVNEYTSMDDLRRKYEKLKAQYIQDTGKQPPE
jgi:hypothetical protein